MSERVFVYGTLMFPEVMAAVLGRAVDGEPAVLADHHRLRVRGAAYPGLVAKAGTRVDGRLLVGLAHGELRRLDAYEGPLYARQCLRVTTADGGGRQAWVYVVPPHRADALTDEPWDPARFARDELAAFLRAF